jgi:membrane-bound metal-dependent hydrolase YbcI (DUF457 family)
MKILKLIGRYLGVAIIVYLLASLLGLNLNPLEWNMGLKILSVIWCIILLDITTTNKKVEN